MFSVVVLSNGADPKRLARTLRSIQNQLYPADEVLVVDRGRTGVARRSVATHERRGGQTPTYLHIPDGDPVVARNRALEQACSRFITFLDEGDELMPLALEQYDRCFRQGPSNLVCYGRSIVRGPAGSLQAPTGRFLPTGYVLAPLMRRTLDIHPRAFACSREAFDRGLRFRPVPEGLASFDLLVRLAQRYPFGCTQEDAVIVDDRRSGGEPMRLTAQCRVLGNLAHELAASLDPEVVTPALSECEYEAGRLWWTVGNDQQAERHLDRAIRLAPRNSRIRILRVWLRSSALLRGHR